MSKLSVTIEGYTFNIELNLPTGSETEIFVTVSGEQPHQHSQTDQVLSVIAPDLVRPPDEMEWFIVDGKPYEILLDADLRWIRSRSGIYPLEVLDQEVRLARPPVGDGRIKAPIPGQVTAILVAVGDEVHTGQPLMVLEAMKMENEIRAPRAGLVCSVNVTPGQGVILNQVLIELE